MPQDIPKTCNGCVKKFLIDHALSCLKGGLVLAQNDNAAKKWGAFGSQKLIPSAILYQPKINSRTVQGGRTGSRTQQEGNTDECGAYIFRYSQGGSGDGQQGKVVAVLARSQGQVEVPAYLRSDVSTHSFWNLGTIAMFDIRIINLYASS